MRKNRLFVGMIALATFVVGLGVFSLKTLSDENVEAYVPRAQLENQNAEAAGSAEWLRQLRADPRTGEINHEAMAQAREQVKMMRMQESVDSLIWEEMGPDNIGGRTRAFLIDRNNPNILYAGGVSGGLFKSTTRGSSWSPINDMQENLAVVSIAQAVNGDIYYGTGEGLYYSDGGTGSGGILGGGLFVKKHNESEFNVLPATVPTPANNTSVNYASIGVVITDRNDANRLWIGTNDGFFISENSGNSFTRVIGLTGSCTDGVQDVNGGMWISINGNGYYSPTGLPNTFTEVTTGGVPQPGLLPRSPGRMVFAVSPQDPNYVYCVQTTGFRNSTSLFHRAYRTTDKGQTWDLIGERSATFNPHNQQGGYDHAVTVDAYNKDRILVGGVNFWEWSLSGGWQQIASGSRFAGSLYVHVDHHRFVYDTTSPGLVYAVNDGGIFRSTNNTLTWSEINKGYITTQFYGIGYSRGGSVMGGTQDNGTILIDRKGNTPKAGIRTNFIEYQGGLMDGDGGFAEISHFDSDYMVKAMQYGVLGRTNNGGENFIEFYDFDRMDPDDISRTLSSQFAPFVTPFYLWQNAFDENSKDTIIFTANDAVNNIGFGLGRNNFQGTMNRPQPSAKFVPGSFMVIASPDTLVADANGNIIGNGSGTFNDTTGVFDITFNVPGGVLTQVVARCAVRYDANDTVTVLSKTLEVPIRHALSQNLNPGETEPIIDPVQSMFFVGLNSYFTSGGERRGGIWMTRGLHDYNEVFPEWVNIHHFGSGQRNTSAFAITKDGNHLFVGTTNGQVHRISGLSDFRTFETNDITQDSTYALQVTQIGSFGRFVTGLAVDPNNSDRLLVTLGEYNASNSIQYSSNATSANPGFISKSGNLPNMPVYDAVFNVHSPQQVVVGTDFGTFSTTNINAGMPQWMAAKEEFANVPVFMLRQEINEVGSGPNQPRFNGMLYAGTHGRGIWKTGNLAKQNPLSYKPRESAFEKEDKFKVFPNPAKTYTKVNLELNSYGDVNMMVRDMSGRVVRSATFRQVAPGESQLELNLEGLPTGTYILQVGTQEFEKTTKFIKIQ
ncbi:MAG: T9SS type A sorting domain-containing protein [Cryomorphaceae bacterium]|nr:T9SS type A sorting domain-containing protein [Cryomorphaceae bacterium]